MTQGHSCPRSHNLVGSKGWEDKEKKKKKKGRHREREVKKGN